MNNCPIPIGAHVQVTAGPYAAAAGARPVTGIVASARRTDPRFPSHGLLGDWLLRVRFAGGEYPVGINELTLLESRP